MGVETMLLLAGGVQAAGGVLQGVGARQNMLNAASDAKTQAKIAQQNAQIASAQGAAQEDLVRRRARSVIGRQRAALAESGADVNAGSAADVLEQSSVEATLDALTARYEGELRRRGYMTEAMLADQRRQQLRSGANAALAQGILGAGSSALQTGAMARYYGV